MPCDAIFSAGACDPWRWTLTPPILTCFLASVCRGAKADVVFLIDGSWSIGEDSFTKVVHFVYGMIGAFDVIGPSGMQVGIENAEPIAGQRCTLASCYIFVFYLHN